jgi:Aldehyde dehydrogenase family
MHLRKQASAVCGRGAAAAKAVARAAVDSLKRCRLELGGKAPVIVFDGADLSRSTPRARSPARSPPPTRGEQAAERGGVGVECTAAWGVSAIEARDALR